MGITDVTPRYANAWSQTLYLRGMSKAQILSSNGYCIDQWWAQTLKKLNPPPSNNRKKKARNLDEDEEDVICKQEEDDFRSSIQKESIPTSKAAFKHHPHYALASLL